MLTERHTFLPRLEHLITSEQRLSAFDVERITTEALLWQTGYLTIDTVEQALALIQYRLRYPNLEVRAALNAALLDRLGGGSSEIPRQTGQLHALLKRNDFTGLKALFTAFFASIPHDWYRSRLDMALRFEGRVYLFELKVVELASAGGGLQQIKDRGYADKYLGQGRPIHLIGVEFSREQRAVVGFEVETLTG